MTTMLIDSQANLISGEDSTVWHSPNKAGRAASGKGSTVRQWQITLIGLQVKKHLISGECLTVWHSQNRAHWATSRALPCQRQRPHNDKQCWLHYKWSNTLSVTKALLWANDKWRWWDYKWRNTLSVASALLASSAGLQYRETTLSKAATWRRNQMSCRQHVYVTSQNITYFNLV